LEFLWTCGRITPLGSVLDRIDRQLGEHTTVELESNGEL
jgi:hypothetical protein